MTKGKEKWRTGKSLQEIQLPGILVSMKNQNTRHIYEFTISSLTLINVK
jgi:hypothetical protein